MKQILIFISFILSIQFSNGQTADEVKTRGDSLYRIKQYKGAARSYETAIKLKKPSEEFFADNIRWLHSLAARSWSLAQNPDSAFFHLNKVAGASDLSFSFFLDLVTSPDLDALNDDKRWTGTKDKLFLNAKNIFNSRVRNEREAITCYDFIDAACAWTMYNIDSAWQMLLEATETKGIHFGNYNYARTVSFLLPLHSDKRWQFLLEAIFQRAEGMFNTPQDSTYSQQELIYKRKDGMALTMIQMKPKANLNHKAIIHIISGSWRSNILNWNYESFKPYIQKGYSVYVVAHGSAPVYSFTDAAADIQRAVRYIRYKAKEFEIDPDKLGVIGYSAGGHLSLICGLVDSLLGANSGDPIDQLSSKVAAVVSYFPPSDFLNWSNEGESILYSNIVRQYNFLNHLFEFRNWNGQGQFEYVTDTTEKIRILKRFSPIYYVSSNDAPVLILHGDKDDVVPISQSEKLVKKLEEFDVPVSLYVKKDAGHGWQRTDEEAKMVMDWFDKYLK